MKLTYKIVKEIFRKNQITKDNTYVVPKQSFEDFISDELMFVRAADDTSCLVFRSLDGKLYNLSEEQLKRFKCVGSCHGC